MTNPTKDALSALSKLIGRPVRIGQYEKVVSISLDSDKATLMVERWEIEDTHREFRIVGHGTKILAWTDSGMTQWDYVGSLAIPDESWIPVIHLKYGEPATPAQVYAKRLYQRMCYRPGSEQSPLDSYNRVLEGASPMSDYW